MNLGDYEEAVVRFRRLLEANPKMQDAWAFYGRALKQLGRVDEAAAAYEKALALSSGGGRLALSIASQMLELGRHADAERIAGAVAAELPDEAAEVLVQSRLGRGDRAGALAMMRQAVAAGTAGERMRVKLGLTLAESGQTGEAIAVLTPLAAEGGPPVLNALGMALSDAGRHQEAIATLERVVREDARNAIARQNLGIVALRLQQPVVATQHLEQALALKADLPIAWNTLGVAHYHLGRSEQAIAAWRRAVELDPAQHDAWFNLGLVAAASGQRQQAREALRHFVAVAPPERFAADIAKARAMLREMGG
jgi:Flp pilus assembly protein TadD